MDLRRLALKNVWQKRGRYLAYLASSAFSVMIYFLYTSLALHPHFQGDYRGATFALRMIQAAAVLLPLFMLVFLLYSSAAFIRSRMKEFGLLSLLGVTRRQMVRMILWENVIIAGTAIALGLAAGVLFLKLFFMVISVLLYLPYELPVNMSGSVWTRTLLVFGTLFFVASILSLRRVLRLNVVELIRAGRKPKETPAFSWVKAILGFALVVSGYVWACHPDPYRVVAGMIPVTIMVSVGTYLLMRESLIALLGLIRKMKHVYHRPGPFLTVSHLTFKIQENYRILASTAVLVAAILSAVGTIFSFYIVSEADVRASVPQAIQLRISNDVDVDEKIAFVQRTLEAHDIDGLKLVRVRVMDAQIDHANAVVVPYSFYASLLRPRGTVIPLDDDETAIWVHPYRWGAVDSDDEAEPTLELHIGDDTITVKVVNDVSGRLLNSLTDVVVFSDRRYEQLVTQYSDANYRTLAVWTGPGWRGRGMSDAIDELRAEFSGDGTVELTTMLETYRARLGEYGLALFLGVFSSLAFFAATCSLLYFRLFTEIDEDRRYYIRLRQLGLTRSELKGLSRIQAMLVFLIPFLVGLVHSTFAMKALGTLMGQSVLTYGWMMALGYLVLYVGFFLGTYALYWQTVGVLRPISARVAEVS